VYLSGYRNIGQTDSALPTFARVAVVKTSVPLRIHHGDRAILSAQKHKSSLVAAMRGKATVQAGFVG